MADKYKTLPIGTIFTYNGNKYKVCNSNACNYPCTSCAFDGVTCDNIKSIRGNCTNPTPGKNTLHSVYGSVFL